MTKQNQQLQNFFHGSQNLKKCANVYMQIKVWLPQQSLCSTISGNFVHLVFPVILYTIHQYYCFEHWCSDISIAQVRLGNNCCFQKQYPHSVCTLVYKFLCSNNSEYVFLKLICKMCESLNITSFFLNLKSCTISCIMYYY